MWPFIVINPLYSFQTHAHFFYCSLPLSRCEYFVLVSFVSVCVHCVVDTSNRPPKNNHPEGISLRVVLASFIIESMHPYEIE